MYMEISKATYVEALPVETDIYVLKLLKNLDEQKQASRPFFLFVCEKLYKLCFIKSTVNACMFYKEDIIFVFYVNDGITFMREASKCEIFFQEFKGEFEVEKKGDVEQFSGMRFIRQNKQIQITQTHLIHQIN